MGHINIEIKARCADHDPIRRLLHERNARFMGTDHQVDTYFIVRQGRLKLREGTIENALIFYNRLDQPGPKQSDVMLHRADSLSTLKTMLVHALGVLTVVDKRREIYFIDNVKFHLDHVQELGSFVEIEAIDADGTVGKETLLAQCNDYLNLFGIPPERLVSGSYSDLLLRRTPS